jgi:hypothetical protein
MPKRARLPTLAQYHCKGLAALKGGDRGQLGPACSRRRSSNTSSATLITEGCIPSATVIR